MVVGLLALVLTIYLLIEGRTAYDWLIAYVPAKHREQAHVTACEARDRIRGYVTGNVATGAFAVVFVFVALTILKVPAALLLALIAGIFDFVPVLGFLCSSVPAVVLALSVSPLVALIVAGLYVGYHLIENYYIGPKVYGGRLRLSHLAVILRVRRRGQGRRHRRGDSGAARGGDVSGRRAGMAEGLSGTGCRRERIGGSSSGRRRRLGGQGWI